LPKRIGAGNIHLRALGLAGRIDDAWLRDHLRRCRLIARRRAGGRAVRIMSGADRAARFSFAPTRRGLALGVAAVGLVGATNRLLAADELASGQFRDEAAALLRRERPNWQLELPADPTVLKIDRELVYLNNLYQTVGGYPQPQRDAGILRFFDAMMAGFGESDVKTFEAARARLRARLVNAAAAGVYSDDDKRALLTRPFSLKARIAYVIDNPQTMAFVSKGRLDLWGVTAEALHATAIENLEAISREVAIEPHAPDSGLGLFVILKGPSDYEAARVLAPKFMERMSEELGPEHFVAAPCRDLLVAWSVDCSIKPQLAAQVTKYATLDAHRLTDELFVWSANGLRGLSPAELAEHGRS
jgi:hypothetical protein